MRFLLLPLAAYSLLAAEYAAPAGIRPALRRPGAATILPGGRVISPLGRQLVTGPGPFGLALSSNGRTLVSSNSGPGRYSLTVAERDKQGFWRVRHLVAPTREEAREEDDWRSVFMGLAFGHDRQVYASEGNSGRVRLVDLGNGNARRLYELGAESYSGDLAFDPERNLLHVLDQAHFRLVTIDTRRHQILASLRLGRLPFAIALSPDRRRAYITNVGMFEYHALPEPISFPAFGFPSPESLRVLGDPNVPESNSLAVVNLEQPAEPRLETFIRTGLPYGAGTHGGSSPSAVLAASGRVFVSNAHNDTITVIDAKTHRVAGEIRLRVAGLEHLRGLLPLGLAYDEASGWLLAAEAGINALAVIEARQGRLIGHLPAGWFPARVLLHEGTVYVSNVKGHGVGPNAQREPGEETFAGTLRRGTISVFPLPLASELRPHTTLVLQANGLRPSAQTSPPLPDAVRYVVLIVKENRTFDEVLGDITRASNGPVLGLPSLARFGLRGYVAGEARFSLHDIAVTPNHHALAQRWAFSDNFYADAEVSVDGHHWLVGAYPNAWVESSWRAAYGGQKDFSLKAPGRLAFAGSNSSVHPEDQPEGGTIWHHLERHGVTFRNFGEGFELAGSEEGPGLEPTGAAFLTDVPMPDPLFRNTSRQYPGYNMNIPDVYRARQFIAEVEKIETLPRFIFIHLPNDHMAKARPGDGYPYEASFVADNDYALGRMVEFLSRTRWWREMAIFITEDDAQGGRDHIDAHRTVLIGAGPWFKRNYVSHVHTSFPGLLKTVFRLLRIPPLNLFDATASDLADMFAAEADFTPYETRPVDRRLFDPERARAARAGPSPRLDDPAVLRRQHRR